MTTPEEAAARVSDLPSFINFLEALAEDSRAAERESSSAAYGSGARGWENGTIAAYLEAAAACIRDHGMNDTAPSWREFAEILLAGKYYE